MKSGEKHRIEKMMCIGVCVCLAVLWQIQPIRNLQSEQLTYIEQQKSPEPVSGQAENTGAAPVEKADSVPQSEYSASSPSPSKEPPFAPQQEQEDTSRHNPHVESVAVSRSMSAVPEMENYTYAGRFKTTAYCACASCSGKWGAQTASGVTATPNHTIAVDPSVIPLGTVVLIDGQEYVAEDTGGAIKGNRIDIYFSSHADALQFGVRDKEVYLAK